MLLPLMQFIFDSSWPAAGLAVFMTATKVWGPLAVGFLIAFFFSTWWIALVGLVFTVVFLWANPKPYESVKWEEVINDG